MEIERFFGVYLLYNENVQFKGRTYIGYTVNPNRRIRQHNVGKHAGGAKRTHGKGPWAMALIVHGFPNDIAALRFEWAWQNPDKSRILKVLNLKKSRKETGFEYRFRVVTHMLRIAPWCRLALTVRWLLQDYKIDFDNNFPPPDHMAIAYGPVKCVKIKNIHGKPTETKENDATNVTMENYTESVNCKVCDVILGSSEKMTCYMPSCFMSAHIKCLARKFLKGEEDQVIPLRGKCPSCASMLLWGELVRHKQGCYMNTPQVCENQQHWSEDLQTDSD